MLCEDSCACGQCGCVVPRSAGKENDLIVVTLDSLQCYSQLERKPAPVRALC